MAIAGTDEFLVVDVTDWEYGGGGGIKIGIEEIVDCWEEELELEYSLNLFFKGRLYCCCG